MLADRIILAAGRGRLDQYTKSLLHFNGANGSRILKMKQGKFGLEILEQLKPL